MDPSQYYINTFSEAFKNLAPIIMFIVGGYIVFIKLPFLFFLKSMREEKISTQDDFKRVNDYHQRDYKLEDYMDFQRRMKIMGAPKKEEEIKKEEPRKAEPKKEDPRKTENKKHFKEEPKQEKRPPQRKARPLDLSAEELFEICPGRAFSKIELKKKYHELLKMNHPDKVASLGPDLKKLAEKKTKEINSAYSKLKSRAA